MFVRWQLRRRQDRRGREKDSLLVAVLVETKREGAQVRQAMRGYLGSIPGRAQAEPQQYTGCRAGFWRKADETLDKLALTKPLRRQIEASIATRVPRPTEADVRRSNRQRDATMRKLAKDLQALMAGLPRARRPRRQPVAQ